jgi:hypothetical protein
LIWGSFGSLGLFKHWVCGSFWVSGFSSILGLFWVPRVIQAFGFGTHFGFLCITRVFGCGPFFESVGFKVRVSKLSWHLYLGLRFRVLKLDLGLFLGLQGFEVRFGSLFGSVVATLGSIVPNHLGLGVLKIRRVL